MTNAERQRGGFRGAPTVGLAVALVTLWPQAEALGTWSIEERGPRNVLICMTPNGTEFIGRFTVRNKRARDVFVETKRRRK